MSYFSKDVEEIIKEFRSSKGGLKSAEIEKLREKYGYNQLEEKEKESALKIFLDTFKDLLVIILLVAGVISMATGDFKSTIVIFAVIILNAILGTVQHLKAAASIESLKALSSPNAKVLRDGIKMEIKSNEVLPGDILLLEAGDLVAADGRILENFSLQVNESSLTGESESVLKHHDIIDKTEIPLGDQKNMVFSGSLVTYGRGKVFVTGIGMKTEIGKIASLLEDTKERKTPLQKSLDDFGKKLSIGIIILSALILVIQIARGDKMLDALMFAVALAVAAIPEALSSIVTIVLALGTQKMAKENAIVKYLKAVEGLGSISVICSDKTGTLTQNKMTTQKIFVNGQIIEDKDISLENIAQKTLVNYSVLCSDASNVDGKEIGDPTEVALVNLGKKHGICETELRKELHRISELPFDSDRKLMSTLNEIHGKYVMITKGAVDVLLRRVKFIYENGETREITQKDIENIENTNKTFSENGLRVLAFAYREFAEKTTLDFEHEGDYAFLGLISMMDPPRVESAEAVADCITAGIKPVMITGDHKITATAIAKEIGIFREGDRSVDGIELNKMSDEELKANVEHISVYARVSPEHKIRIVNAWQDLGHIVAMTGDGVNDAPALKQANIGIAMGITGTEVSKEAASMILTDDNFATIVKSIEYGRNIYNNIQNSIKFLLSGNMGAILAVMYATLAGLAKPFAPVHLLFINLLTDSLPAIAIGLEKPHADILKQKPRDTNESILNKKFMTEVLIEGLLIAIVTMIAFYIGLQEDVALGQGNLALHASTMAFAVLCLSRLWHGFTCRGDKSIFQLGVFTNKVTIVAFLLGLGLLTSVLYIPDLSSLFKVEHLNGEQLKWVFGLPLIPFGIIQIFKAFKK